MTQENEERQGWGIAPDPHTPTGLCKYSRLTPLGTYDCIHTANMRVWKPAWFPGRTFKSPSQCKFAKDMVVCPLYEYSDTYKPPQE